MKKVFLSFVLMVISAMAFAQLQTAPEWNSILGNSPETFKTQLVSSSESSIKVNVQVPGFYATTVTTPKGEAKIISMPKAVSTAQAGEPNVPMTGIPVMIGDKASMAARVIDAQYMDFENIEVAPSKGDFPRSIDPATVPYTYGDCYSRDAFFPASNLDLYEPYIIRDFRGQNMAVYPFAYNPVSKTLRVYYNLTVEMYKVDDRGENVIESRRSNEVKMDPDFKSVYQRHFINYEANMAKYTPLDEEGDLLIICYDNFMSYMEDFVNWKKTRGINTTMVGTTTAGSSYTAIKNYIQSQYNANNNITHVLLVGDVAQIPGYSYSGGGSSYSGLGDNAYGQIVGSDYYNDVFVGRFSAQTAAQVTTQVNRVITYERDLTTSATWLQKADGIARNEGGSGHNGEDDYEHMDVIRTDLLNYGYNTVYQDYENLSGYTGTASSISSHINSGVGIVNYCNHGNNQLWGVASYSNTQVNQLTNSNKLPFIWSVACLVGKYDNTSTSYGSNYTIGQNNDCFAEAWMHATYSSSDLTPTGAVGALMSYISQPWIPPMWAQDECVDILAGLSSSGGTKHTWGGISINGLFGIFDNYGTDQSAVGTYQAWILYGDPSMMVRTKTPQAMTVNHSGSLPMGSSTYSVNVTNGNGAVATITDANHNILGKATVSNGTANVAINGNLTAGSDLTLCVFGYNKVTYLGTIQVVSNNAPYISVDSYTPDIALIGQNTNLSITFKNVGSQATSGNTTVTLTSSNATFGVNSKTFGALAANASTTVSGFSFTLNNGVTLGNPVTFHYTATNGSNTWEGDFSITPNQVFTVNVSANNADYGTVSGGGQYNYNESCTVTATPADGYMFTSWTQNGNVVSTNAAYTFNVTSNVDLVANFAAGVMIGDGGTSTSEYLPSYNYYNYTLSEQIYTSAELGGAGIITSIAFYNGGAAKTRNYDFYMKATTKSSFTGKTDWITVSASDKVFSGSVAMVANDWTTITFATPFVYDGTSNVVLVADDNTGTYTSSPHMTCRVFSTTSSQALYYYDDNNNFNPLSPPTSSGTYNYVMSSKNQIVLTKEAIPTESFNIVVSANPAQAATVTGGGEYQFGQTVTVAATPNEGYTFTGWTENGNTVSSELSFSFTATCARTLVANFIQAIEIGTDYSTHNYLPTYNYYNYSMTEQIYTADEIGMAGTINSIAFYNEGAEKTRTLDFYLKATTKNAFSSKTDWVTVAASDKVFSGSVTLAANVWTFVNFTTPFEYDGTTNLVLVVDDNTGGYSYSPHMACSVYNANGTQSIYIYSDGTDYNPASPTTSQSSNYATLEVKNHILMGITVSNAYTITATANPTEGGTVSGGGTFEEGESCTLTATVNNGYRFANWTENGSVVSTNANYTFTVNADRDLVANFEEGSSSTVTQTVVMSSGSNWWTANVVVTLAQLEAALGDNGLMISAQDGSSVTYDETFGWGGDLAEIEVGKMYIVQTKNNCTFELEGTAVDPNNYTITLTHGNNWIGFNGSQATEINAALANLNATADDVITSQDGFSASYDVTFGWGGDLTTLQPGQAYIYTSNASGTKSFKFSSSKGGDTEFTKDDFYWSGFDYHDFMYHMDIRGKAYFDGVLVDNRPNIEIASFVNGELRGTKYLVEAYPGPLPGVYFIWNACYYDNLGETFTFKAYDHENGIEYDLCDVELIGTSTAQGTPSNPIAFHFTKSPSFGPDYPWTPSTAYSGDGMLVLAQVKIDGELVTRDTYEVGAFCGDECRANSNGGNGSNLDDWTDVNLGYFAWLTIKGNDGDVINFYLYDKESNSVVRAECPTTIEMVNDGELGLDPENGDLFVLNFITTPFFTKDIEAYTPDPDITDHYYLIATPIGTVAPADVEGMTANTFDLYRFNQSVDLEWENYKDTEHGHEHFNLEPGRGYLYANSVDTRLVFAGNPYDEDELVVPLVYDNNAKLPGWNLIGNPYSTTVTIDKSFYVMNGDGTELIANERSAVGPMEGIFVHVSETGQSVTFAPDAKRDASNDAWLTLNLTHNGGNILDRVIVRFNDNNVLPKFQLFDGNAKLYIPQDGKDYAVVSTNDENEMPVCFKAGKNGTYTLSFNTENVEMGYLHLIDNLTGNDIDLLATPSYSFDAKTSDYASRFRLVFATNNNNDNQFAFIGNGEIILNGINGNTTVQLFDVTGRMLSSTNGVNRISTQNMAAGVYMLRLVNGNDVKTQKIVVK